jgi:hypothetical protein
MNVVPFKAKPPPQNPAQDRCLLALLRSTLSMQEAMDMVRSSGRNSVEAAALLEAFRASLRSSHAAMEGYMALAYPDRFKPGHADAP